MFEATVKFPDEEGNDDSNHMPNSNLSDRRQLMPIVANCLEGHEDC